MGKVKGTKIRSKIHFLNEVYGTATTTKVLDSLSAKDRAELSSLLDLGWYDIDLFERLLGAIVSVAAKGNDHVLKRIGHYGAEDLSQNAYKVYYRSPDPQVLLSKMVPIHESLNDPGDMEIVKHNERHLSIVVREPRNSPNSCRIAHAFYERSIEQCDVSNVAVVEKQCSSQGAPFCVFDVTWDPAT